MNRGALVACKGLRAENTERREAQASPPQHRPGSTGEGLTERTGAEGSTVRVRGFTVLRNNKNHGSANGNLNGIFLVI